MLILYLLICFLILGCSLFTYLIINFKNDKPNKSDNPGKSDKPDKPSKPNKPNKPDKPDIQLVPRSNTLCPPDDINNVRNLLQNKIYNSWLAFSNPTVMENRGNDVDLRDYIEIYNILFPVLQGDDGTPVDPLLDILSVPTVIYHNYGQTEDAPLDSDEYKKDKQIEQDAYDKFIKQFTTNNDSSTWGTIQIPNLKNLTYNDYLLKACKLATLQPLKLLKEKEASDDVDSAIFNRNIFRDTTNNMLTRTLPNSQFWTTYTVNTSTSINDNLVNILTQQIQGCLKSFQTSKVLTITQLTDDLNFNPNPKFYNDPEGAANKTRNPKTNPTIQENIDTYHTTRKKLRSLGVCIKKLTNLIPVLSKSYNGTTFSDILKDDNLSDKVSQLLVVQDNQINNSIKTLNVTKDEFMTLRAMAYLKSFSLNEDTDGCHNCYKRCTDANLIKKLCVQCGKKPKKPCFNAPGKCDFNKCDYISMMGLCHDAFLDIRSGKQQNFDQAQIKGIVNFITPKYKLMMSMLTSGNSTDLVILLNALQGNLCKGYISN